MEASALPAPSGLARTRISVTAPLLRLRSDEQLVTLFRNGNSDAFRVIYDRYSQRLFAYARQMLRGSRQDAEDALQDVFVSAYRSLRTHDRDLALRAWLYRVAHNRCVDELRRPAELPAEMIELAPHSLSDPIAEAEQREALRRLIDDVRELPGQQRSALLMRELSGMSYDEVSAALGVSVGAVKSLLVRARVGLVEAAEARGIACAEVREELAAAHDRHARAGGVARRHVRGCSDCREFRSQLRGTSKQLAAFAPSVGPLAALLKLLGVGSGAATGSGSSAAAGGGIAAIGLGGGGVFSLGALTAGAGHIATILATAVITAGGAVEIQQTLSPPLARHARVRSAVSVLPRPASVPHRSFAPLAGRPHSLAPPPQSAPPQDVSPPTAPSTGTNQGALPVLRRSTAGNGPRSGTGAAPRTPSSDGAPSAPGSPASQTTNPLDGQTAVVGGGGPPSATVPATDPPASGPSASGTTAGTASGAQPTSASTAASGSTG